VRLTSTAIAFLAAGGTALAANPHYEFTAKVVVVEDGDTLTHYLPAEQPSPKPITLAAIIESMEAREKLADSVAVRWNQSTWYSARALLPKPCEFMGAREMLLRGASARCVGKSFSSVGEELTQIDHVSSYDGDLSWKLEGLKPPRGYIEVAEKGSYRDTNNSIILPLMLYVRPLAEPYDTLSRTTLKLLDQRRTIDGHECVGVDDGRTRVYLDRDRDFIPVACQRYLPKSSRVAPPGFVLLDGSIEYYRKQDAMRWYPKAFQLTKHYQVAGVSSRTRGDSVQTTIGVAIKDGAFALSFGPGTIVYDARTRGVSHSQRRVERNYPTGTPASAPEVKMLLEQTGRG
jgi:hypothetical protein